MTNDQVLHLQAAETSEDDVRAAIAQLGVDRFNFLCFEHDDVHTRAGYQVTVLALAAGATGNLTPTEEELRVTPAGRAAVADGSWFVCQRCGADCAV
jgi:hypothetical protein